MCGGQKFSEFQVDCLEAHNSFRVQHGSPRIELDKALCDYAKLYAEYLAKCNLLVPSKDCTFGENIFFKCSDRKIYPDAIEVGLKVHLVSYQKSYRDVNLSVACPQLV